MKKTILIFLLICIICIVAIAINYSVYKIEYDSIAKGNLEFEQYKDREIYGIQLGTIINKVIDKNTKNEIEKNEKGIFIPNDENSIEIDIYMIDNETTYKMESIYNAGMEEFVEHYRNIKFKCSKIEYHKNTGRVKYLYFEQIQTS